MKKLVVQTVVLTAVVLLAVIPFSCRLTEEGVRISGGDYVAPSIETVEVVDSSTVRMDFSEPVKITSVVASKVIKDVSDSPEHSGTQELSLSIKAASGGMGRVPVEANVSEDGLCVNFLFENECEVGQAYEILGVVEDKTGNTLTFCIPFTGFNSRVPQVIITEVQIKYSKGKGEFVELFVLKDGNLGGLEILSGVDGEEKKYELPPIEVSKGETVLVHMRKVDDDCVNEIGENLSEATASYSVKNIRDLWSDNTSARFNDSSDVIVLRNGLSGQILDAMMYVAENVTEWKPAAESLAKTAVEYGIFDDAVISSAISSKGASYAKSFQRVNAKTIKTQLLNDEDVSFPVKFSSENWNISSASPGSF